MQPIKQTIIKLDIFDYPVDDNVTLLGDEEQEYCQALQKKNTFESTYVTYENKKITKECTTTNAVENEIPDEIPNVLNHAIANGIAYIGAGIMLLLIFFTFATPV